MSKNIKNGYQKRPIRFVELYAINDWQVKIYTIEKDENTKVSSQTLANAKKMLPTWLQKSNLYATLQTYQIATLILHQGKEGCFSIISWWIDDNMLQLFVHLAKNETPEVFELFSENGIVTCVWEMEVLWHERNAWIRHVLSDAEKPNFEGYLNDVICQIT